MTARRLSPVPDSPRRAVLYIRVSAVMGRGDDFHSPELQAKAIRDVLARRNMVEVERVEDIDRTGRDFNREGIRRVRDMAKDGQVDVVALYDLSRLGRNAGESLRVIAELRDLGVDILSTVEQIDDSPEGQFMLGQFLGMAQLYSDQRSRQWKQVAQHRVEQGLPAGGDVPLGYRRSSTAKGGPLEPDPATADLIPLIYRAYDQGVPLRVIAAEVSWRRGRRIDTSSLRHVLRNPTYIGRLRRNGKDYPGQHPPLVDEALWHRVQRLHAANRAKAPRALARSYTLTGLVMCTGCQYPMTCHRQLETAGEGYYVRLFCRSSRDERGACIGSGFPRADQLEKAILDQLTERVSKLRIDTTAQTTARAAAARARVDVRRLRRELDETKTAIGRLAADHARRVISDMAYTAASKELETEHDQLALALGDAEAATSLAAPRKAMAAGKAVLAAWPDATDEERGRLLRQVLLRVWVRPAVRWREPVADRIDVDWIG